MLRTILKSKLHRATVTQTELNYVGSITIDEDLLERADILEYEKVLVVNLNSGARFETYVTPGTRGSGTVCINGAAARLAEVGDKVIVMSFMTCPDGERFPSTVVHVNSRNMLVN